MAQMPKLRKVAEISKARVLIVDDQPIVRKGLVHLLGGEPDFAPCCETDDPRQAFALAAAIQPDLIVTGLSLKESHGLEFLKDLRVRCPEIPVLVFSMYDGSLYAERAIRAGASGFVTKSESTEEVLRAIRSVLDGEIHLNNRLTSQSLRRFFTPSMVNKGSDLERLSDRELELFEYEDDTVCCVSEKEQKLLPVYEPLQEELDARSDLTFVYLSKPPPLERLRVIQNLLRTGAGRSSLAAKTPLLHDASISPPIPPLSPSKCMKKGHLSFSTSNKHVLRVNLQTWFSPERKSRLKLPKTPARIR